jgi:hypothetical protein
MAKPNDFSPRPVPPPSLELQIARRRRWRAAFLLLLFAVVLGGLEARRRLRELEATLTGLRESHADCEAHRDLLHEVARSSAEASDFEALPPVARIDGAGTTHRVGAAQLRVEYDGRGRYLGSTLGASSTPR